MEIRSQLRIIYQHNSEARAEIDPDHASDTRTAHAATAANASMTKILKWTSVALQIPLTGVSGPPTPRRGDRYLTALASSSEAPRGESL